jgi:SNF2 family DNA or RNA helicase
MFIGYVKSARQFVLLENLKNRKLMSNSVLPCYKNSNLNRFNHKEEFLDFAHLKFFIHFSVIVSQWTAVLSLLEPHLKERRIRFTSITGQIQPKIRQERINDFNRMNGGVEVMLLSLMAGGVGLNLVGGNHLFIVDLHWNPAMENQACDRIYRVGQTKDVFIHKLVLGKNKFLVLNLGIMFA